MSHVKNLVIFFVVLVCFTTVGRSAPEFSGVLKSGGKMYLALRPGDTAAAAWYQIGDRFGEFSVVSYDDARETVVLSRDGAVVELRLKGARVESAPTVALVEELARKGDQELQKLLPVLKQLEARRAKTAADLADLEARTPVEKDASERVAEFRRKLKLEDDNLAYFLQRVVKSNPTQSKP